MAYSKKSTSQFKLKDLCNLIGEVLDNNNTVNIYHYSSADAESLMLDPLYFNTKRGSYSRKEHDKSAVPRTFFYVNPSEKETFFRSSNLYKAAIPLSDVYDLSSDPERLVKKTGTEMFGSVAPNYDKLLSTLSGWEYADGTWQRGKGLYEGAQYNVGNFTAVIMFVPVKVDRVAPEEKAELEGENLNERRNS